jgi:hypothetical protein
MHHMSLLVNIRLRLDGFQVTNFLKMTLEDSSDCFSGMYEDHLHT